MSNPFKRGHKRFGGRKVGSPYRKDGNPGPATQARVKQIQEVAARELNLPMHDLTPLEGLVMAMHWALSEQDRAGFVAACSAAAPYLHPRLQNTELRISQNFEHLTDQELAAKIAEVEARIAESKQAIEIEKVVERAGPETDPDLNPEKLN